MPNNDRSESDPEQGTRASRIVKQVAGCDASIKGVVVLDGLGHIIAGWSPASATTTDQLSASLVSKLGIVAKVVMGAMEKETGMLGRMDFLVAAFQNDKLVLTDLQDQSMTLVFGISRSTMADSVYDKVAKILAATK